MIQIISGVKGKGKTKFLIQKANEAVKAANGSVVYLWSDFTGQRSGAYVL